MQESQQGTVPGHSCSSGEHAPKHRHHDVHFYMARQCSMLQWMRQVKRQSNDIQIYWTASRSLSHSFYAQPAGCGTCRLIHLQTHGPSAALRLLPSCAPTCKSHIERRSKAGGLLMHCRRVESCITVRLSRTMSPLPLEWKPCRTRRKKQKPVRKEVHTLESGASGTAI